MLFLLLSGLAITKIDAKHSSEKLREMTGAEIRKVLVGTVATPAEIRSGPGESFEADGESYYFFGDLDPPEKWKYSIEENSICVKPNRVPQMCRFMMTNSAGLYYFKWKDGLGAHLVKISIKRAK